MTSFSPLNRRQFLAGAAGLSAVGLMSGMPRPAFADTGSIDVVTWETYSDDDWLAEYTKSTGVKINPVRVGSIDELFAQVQSNALSPDLSYYDTGTAVRFKNAGLIVPMETDKIPNRVNVSPAMDWETKCSIDGALYGIPYNWGTQPLIYNKDAVTEEPTSWAALWDPKYAGKVNIFDDAYVTMQMIALYVGAADPFNMTDAEFDKCAEALRALRPQVGTIARGFDDATTIYSSGDAVIGYCQNISIVNKLNELGKNFAYALPAEGTPTWIDCSFISEKGRRQEVYDFINASLARDWQARFISRSYNNGILTAQAAQEAGIPTEILDRTNILDQAKDGFWQKIVVSKLPEDIDRRVAMWNDFKAGTL